MTLAASLCREQRDRFSSTRLERVFERCFRQQYNTRLRGGAVEPVYLPAQREGEEHRLCYRADYFASALHETAHWCIAGRARRRQEDFGYWYTGGDRSTPGQRAFESVEDKPQALEWFFSLACGWQFRVSVDNLDPVSGALPDTTSFRRRILSRALYWQRTGLPPRADVFYRALCREFGTAASPRQLDLKLPL
ncbi:MAG: elongation factor P hydroxylase [Halioglobus sp.]|nr:elongation factor P hydroxylase [Halioglobus sp.]